MALRIGALRPLPRWVPLTAAGAISDAAVSAAVRQTLTAIAAPYLPQSEETPCA
jgi:hypothetical protein